MKQKLNIYLAVLTAALFCACSDDDLSEQMQSHSNIVLGIQGGGKAYGLEWIAETQSRADGEPLPADIPDSIGVFAYRENWNSSAVLDNEKYCHATNYPKDTINTGKPWVETRYKFFGYAPYSSDVKANGTTYSLFKGIDNWTIPNYSNQAYVRSDIIDVTYPTNSAYLDGNVVNMSMKHLMSRLRFCFKLGPKYGDLRKIRVKEVKVIVAANDTITLKTEPEDGYVEISAAKESLGFQPLASLYVNPNVEIQRYTFTLRTRYDVLDKTSQLLRKDEVSENVFDTNTLLTEGKYRDVQILVEPKFLYILSDNDVMEEAQFKIN